jgi:long-chain acyl-CoA synthetase
MRQDHRPLPLLLRAQFKIADRLVFQQVREAFGGRLSFAVTGAAPLAPEVLAFFQGAGVLLLEGWGLTEAGGGLALNAVDCYRIGTVGHVYPGHEVRIANDGEVLVRGPCLCAGYHNNQRATDEAFDGEGWFHTGDIGSVDSAGFLRIVDRKKDLIVTAGGENVAPQAVEEALRTIPYVSQACVYGEGRPYLVALLTLKPDAVTGWANEHGIAAREVQDIATTPQFRTCMDEQITKANAGLAKHEAVHKYDILAEDFTVANELLTPVQKIRRQGIHERYRTQFQALYHEVRT